MLKPEGSLPLVSTDRLLYSWAKMTYAKAHSSINSFLPPCGPNIFPGKYTICWLLESSNIDKLAQEQLEKVNSFFLGNCGSLRHLGKVSWSYC